MVEKQQNMQDVFLNATRKDKKPVTIYLTNGVKLQGIITGFDNFCVVLKRNQISQLVYKHSIATVVPAAQVSMMSRNGDEGGAGADEFEDQGMEMA